FHTVRQYLRKYVYQNRELANELNDAKTEISHLKEELNQVNRTMMSDRAKYILDRDALLEQIETNFEDVRLRFQDQLSTIREGYQLEQERNATTYMRNIDEVLGKRR